MKFFYCALYSECKMNFFKFYQVEECSLPVHTQIWEFIAAVEKEIDDNPEKFMRILARKRAHNKIISKEEKETWDSGLTHLESRSSSQQGEEETGLASPQRAFPFVAWPMATQFRFKEQSGKIYINFRFFICKTSTVSVLMISGVSGSAKAGKASLTSSMTSSMLVAVGEEAMRSFCVARAVHSHDWLFIRALHVFVNAVITVKHDVSSSSLCSSWEVGDCMHTFNIRA